MSDKASKQEALEKIINCETRIIALEKNRKVNLYSKRHEYRSLYCNLEELDINFCADLKAQKHELQQELSRIRGNVGGFRRMLSGMKPDPAFVEKLKQTMEGIETFIMAFKEKQREIYEALLLEEQTVAQEITAFERKLDSWTSIPRAQHMKLTSAASGGTGEPLAGGKPEPSAMPPAVLAFQLFLQQTGGRQGNWDDYDHKVFLKTRTIFNGGNAAFLEAVARDLPTKTPAEILQHEQWYVEFSTLLESKRKAIEAWREEKQKRKPAEMDNDSHVAPKKTSKQEAVVDKEREARFSKLDAWKAELKLRQVEAQEQKLKMELQAVKQKEREIKQRAAQKHSIEEYMREKDAELSEKRSREEARRHQELTERRLANREIEKFRERDMSVIMARKKKEEMKELEKLERERQLELLKEQVIVQHDPTRLYKLTKGWEERKKAKAEPTMDRTSTSLPRRAVPSWRQGL